MTTFRVSLTRLGLLLWIAAMLFLYLILQEPWVYDHRRTRGLHAEVERWFTARGINQ